MKENFKTAAVVITAVLIAAFFTGCQQDDEVVAAGSATVSSAKEWFKEYEGKGDNYVYLQNLNYEWSGAIVKQAEDGTETIVVPIKELKINQSEIWQQRLYLYKLPDGSYKASVVEIYPDKAAPQENQSMEGGNFNGYISVWDLKKGFVKAAQFKNNHAVEDGIVEVLDREDKATYKAPPLNPCFDGSCNDSPGGGNPIQLRTIVIDLLPGIKLNEVVIVKPKPKSDPSPKAVFAPRSPIIGGTTPGGYTSHGGGSGGGGIVPPPATVLNPCDKIKILMANPNFIVKLEELLKKTNLKIENGYSQSKNGPFTPLLVGATTESTDKLYLNTTADMIGYTHTHLDDYDTGKVNSEGDALIRKPIRMFSPADIGIFLGLVKNAQANNIPVDSVYGAMISSDGNYQLRFTGDPTQINPNFDWNTQTLKNDYLNYMKRGNKESSFLSFLKDKSYIKGIELYKINRDKTNTKNFLDTNDKIQKINC